MSNEFELEFDVSNSASAPVERKSKTVESKSETTEKSKSEVVKNKEKQGDPLDSERNTINEPSKDSGINKKFQFTNVIDNLETWLKESKGFKFWLKFKVICALPFLIIVIIFVAVVLNKSNSLSKANKNLEELTQVKDSVESLLTENNLKIEELNKTIENLEKGNKKLESENKDLKKKLTPAKTAAKPTSKKK